MAFTEEDRILADDLRQDIDNLTGQIDALPDDPEGGHLPVEELARIVANLNSVTFTQSATNDAIGTVGADFLTALRDALTARKTDSETAFAAIGSEEEG